MSKIQTSPNIAQVKPEEVQRFVDLFCNDVANIVNGQLDFATNFNSKTIDITFTVADTNTSVGHGLGRAPGGYLVTALTAAMVVYNGSVDNTSNTLTLRSSAVGTASLVIF